MYGYGEPGCCNCDSKDYLSHDIYDCIRSLAKRIEQLEKLLEKQEDRSISAQLESNHT